MPAQDLFSAVAAGCDGRWRARREVGTREVSHYNDRVALDVPDEVRNKALADGNAAWLDDLPSVLDALARDWSLTIGAAMRGGHAALVVEATLADGTPSVLKVGLPGHR